MQIILLDKITNLGSLGDIVEVKTGYARNFLIPKGLAKRATAANRAEFEARRAELERLQADKLGRAQSQAEKMDGLMLQITRNASVDGRLFGSVSNVDVVEALKAQGFEVERSAVQMPDGAIKQVGDNAVTIALHADVAANITVSVLGEHQQH